MKVRFTVAFLPILLPATAGAQVDNPIWDTAPSEVIRRVAEAAKPHYRTWMVCVVKAAKGYATGPDAAAFIAGIAAKDCDEAKQATLDAMRQAGGPDAVSVEAIRLMNADAVLAASRAVLDARARNSQPAFSTAK